MGYDRSAAQSNVDILYLVQVAYLQPFMVPVYRIIGLSVPCAALPACLLGRFIAVGIFARQAFARTFMHALLVSCATGLFRVHPVVRGVRDADLREPSAQQTPSRT